MVSFPLAKVLVLTVMHWTSLDFFIDLRDAAGLYTRSCLKSTKMQPLPLYSLAKVTLPNRKKKTFHSKDLQ